MAIPTAASNPSLDDVWRVTQHNGASIRNNSIVLRDFVATGTVRSKDLIDFGSHLKKAITTFNEAKDPTKYPGMQAYAKEQINEPSINIRAEFTATADACITIRDWLLANFPNNSGFLESIRWAPANDGTYIWGTISLTVADQATLTDQLNALIATIRAPV